jgi:hypothetical protein
VPVITAQPNGMGSSWSNSTTPTSTIRSRRCGEAQACGPSIRRALSPRCSTPRFVRRSLISAWISCTLCPSSDRSDRVLGRERTGQSSARAAVRGRATSRRHLRQLSRPREPLVGRTPLSWPSGVRSLEGHADRSLQDWLSGCHRRPGRRRSIADTARVGRSGTQASGGAAPQRVRGRLGARRTRISDSGACGRRRGRLVGRGVYRQHGRDRRSRVHPRRWRARVSWCALGRPGERW